MAYSCADMNSEGKTAIQLDVEKHASIAKIHRANPATISHSVDSAPVPGPIVRSYLF